LPEEPACKSARGKGTFTAAFSLGQGIGFYVVDGKLCAGHDD
jgi:hypothetical protein